MEPYMLNNIETIDFVFKSKSKRHILDTIHFKAFEIHQYAVDNIKIEDDQVVLSFSITDFNNGNYIETVEYVCNLAITLTTYRRKINFTNNNRSNMKHNTLPSFNSFQAVALTLNAFDEYKNRLFTLQNNITCKDSTMRGTLYNGHSIVFDNTLYIEN